MANPAIKRIQKRLNLPNVVDTLSKQLSISDLTSLLLAVFQNRSKNFSPTALLKKYENDRFVKPAHVDAKVLTEFDRIAFQLLPKSYQAVEFSPLAPLGSVSALASIDQNNIVSTIRGNEVCSDNTNMMALECALRRKKAKRNKATAIDLIRLCSSHRVVRGQLFDGPASFAHFRIFSLCIAGRDSGNFEFEINALKDKVEFYISLFLACLKNGFNFKSPTLHIKTQSESVRFRLFETINNLQKKYSNFKFNLTYNPSENWSYYQDIRFQIFAADKKEQHLIADGGSTDWNRKLLSDEKERLMISGMGSERFIYLFGNTNT